MQEARNAVGDDRLGFNHGGLARLEARFDNLPEVVQRVEKDVVEPIHFRFNVARHGQIDHHHRPVAPRLEGALDHAEADDRQRTGGTGNHDIVLGQTLAKLIQTHEIAAKARRQIGAPLKRAVGNGEALRLLRGEVGRAQLDHFAGADKQHLLRCQAVENSRREMHCRGRHRHRVSTDRGGRAHFLGDGKGTLEQFSEQRAERPGFFRGACRLLHLSEYLRLAKHHRVQPGRDTKHVAHCILLRMLVEVRLNLLRRERVVFGQPVCRRLGIFGSAIQLGAIAGRQDRGFAYGFRPQQVVQSQRHAGWVERHLLAYCQRGRMMIDTQSEQLHGDMPLRQRELRVTGL